MNKDKNERWKQRFENFEKVYKLIEKYSEKKDMTEIERAGMIQFFEMGFELAWKTIKDYLEFLGFAVKSPRESIKEAFRIEIIDDGYIWMQALESRNMTVHMYDERLAEKMQEDISNIYFPELKKLYEKLKEKI
jgi:nucleotidyltransferase substrate binding protein (TIGR01987 family)